MRTSGRAPCIRFTGAKQARGRGREHGAVAIMFVGLLVVIIGFCGLALELSQLYNRKVEMQNVADTAALAAAYELNGTSEGIRTAVQKAAARFTAATPSQLTYQYSSHTMSWSDRAIEFGTTPTGPWVTYDSALGRASPNGLLYVRVDTGGLDASYGQVTTAFMRVVASNLATVSTGASAVAGRAGIAVTPLGICIMRPEAARNRSSELEEYGFRRGISYDLMQLNPDAPDAGKNFLIDPFIAPGATGPVTSATDTIAPFVCTGTMGVARVMGGAMTVTSPFPLTSLYRQLNSRFDVYDTTASACSPDSAPPDTNIRAYTFNGTTVGTWMSTARGGQAAAITTDGNRRSTVAGPDPSATNTVAGQYGVLWSYAKAVNYAASEPSGGYTPYDASTWSTLYSPAQPTASAYPSLPPYFKASYASSPSSGHTALLNRRVLNVALLSCPVSGNSAGVVGIGRFFMTVPADDTHLYAEFAGLVQEQTLRAEVKLYP